MWNKNGKVNKVKTFCFTVSFFALAIGFFIMINGLTG